MTAAPSYIVRASRLDDIGALIELARLSGPGFTSLPEDETLLARRLEKSAESFSGLRTDDAAFVLMMEEASTRAIVGCAAVKGRTGATKPFFNYRILRVSQSSAAARRRFDMDVMVLVNDFAGATEVGSLFLKPEARGGGAGRLLAQSRYLLIAAAPHLFSETVIAELRGDVSADGRSAFWEHLGEKFFRMSFTEADELSALTDNQFIMDLMPKYPIYIDLLPEDAQATVGAVHPDGEGAKSLLEWEGFRYDRVIDIFDGGPLVSAPRDQIRTLRESEIVSVASAGDDAPGALTLLSTDDLSDFRVMRTDAEQEGASLRAPASSLSALGLEEGARARAWVRR